MYVMLHPVCFRGVFAAYAMPDLHLLQPPTHLDPSATAGHAICLCSVLSGESNHSIDSKLKHSWKNQLSTSNP